MRKLLASIIIAGTAALVLGAGTWAYFTDTETSSGNSMAAGTLDLKVNGSDDPNVAPFTLSNLKPGDNGTEYITVTNAGSILGHLALDTTVVETPGSTPEPEPTPDNGELGANVNVQLYHAGAPVPFYNGTLAGLTSYNPGGYHVLPSGETHTIEVHWAVPGTAGNDIMDDGATLNVNFELKQP